MFYRAVYWSARAAVKKYHSLGDGRLEFPSLSSRRPEV